jgi:hypothetical protein
MIKWASLPDGLKVLPSPKKLDDSLVSKLVYIRWEPPHGWSLGPPSLTRLPLRRRVSSRSTISRSSTSTAQQDLPTSLSRTDASGPTAPYNSWCLLEKDEAAE